MSSESFIVLEFSPFFDGNISFCLAGIMLSITSKTFYIFNITLKVCSNPHFGACDSKLLVLLLVHFKNSVLSPDYLRISLNVWFEYISKGSVQDHTLLSDSLFLAVIVTIISSQMG